MNEPGSEHLSDADMNFEAKSNNQPKPAETPAKATSEEPSKPAPEVPSPQTASKEYAKELTPVETARAEAERAGNDRDQARIEADNAAKLSVEQNQATNPLAEMQAEDVRRAAYKTADAAYEKRLVDSRLIYQATLAPSERPTVQAAPETPAQTPVAPKQPENQSAPTNEQIAKDAPTINQLAKDALQSVDNDYRSAFAEANRRFDAAKRSMSDPGDPVALQIEANINLAERKALFKARQDQESQIHAWRQGALKQAPEPVSQAASVRQEAPAAPAVQPAPETQAPAPVPAQPESQPAPAASPAPKPPNLFGRLLGLFGRKPR